MVERGKVCLSMKIPPKISISIFMEWTTLCYSSSLVIFAKIECSGVNVICWYSRKNRGKQSKKYWQLTPKQHKRSRQQKNSWQYYPQAKSLCPYVENHWAGVVFCVVVKKSVACNGKAPMQQKQKIVLSPVKWPSPPVVFIYRKAFKMEKAYKTKSWRSFF